MWLGGEPGASVTDRRASSRCRQMHTHRLELQWEDPPRRVSKYLTSAAYRRVSAKVQALTSHPSRRPAAKSDDDLNAGRRLLSRERAAVPPGFTSLVQRWAARPMTKRLEVWRLGSTSKWNRRLRGKGELRSRGH